MTAWMLARDLHCGQYIDWCSAQPCLLRIAESAVFMELAFSAAKSDADARGSKMRWQKISKLWPRLTANIISPPLYLVTSCHRRKGKIPIFSFLFYSSPWASLSTARPLLLLFRPRLVSHDTDKPPSMSPRLVDNLYCRFSHYSY